jgi:hypothetical protein
MSNIQLFNPNSKSIQQCIDEAYASFNVPSLGGASTDGWSKMSDFQRRSIISEFKKLDFRESHIEEAVGECKDREETLEWLLIHVPEDDLPRWALPEGYVAGISMASSNLKREAAIKRLAECGYSVDLCKQVLEFHGDGEGKAAEALQNILMSSGQTGTSTPSTVALSLDPQAEDFAARNVLQPPSEASILEMFSHAELK